MQLGRCGLGSQRPSLPRGSLLWLGQRRFLHAQSRVPKKENTLGVGFRLRRTPTKQQGPGSQRQPSPALPDGERPAGCENGLRCFTEQRWGGAGVAR